MAIRLYAVIPEMDTAVSKLDRAIDEFTSAVQTTRSAADTVAAGWEGDAQVAFVAEQAEALQYYEQMSQLVTEFTNKVQEASKAYTDTDHQCAGILRAV